MKYIMKYIILQYIKLNVIYMQIIRINVNYSNICLYGTYVNYAKRITTKLVIGSHAVWINLCILLNVIQS